ncbi:MAG TPA: response regulator transcription factor [Acidimicrobiales bacterium]|jgi:two-component system response regulator RegX3|nr:response regulator transcription factor [Acidimicrobiales bacterium]
MAGSENIRVLVVEDEESYRQALASGLSREGFVVDVAADGPEGLRRFIDQPPDIVLLDLLLPGLHGTEVCRRMRDISPVPIVMVSAVGAELDVVLGLELGAAGYVTKPFRLRELVARMEAILRRVSPPELPALEREPNGVEVEGEYLDEAMADVTFGAVGVDFVRREVSVEGRPVHLSRREFDLLAVLLTPVRRVRTREELIDLLWPDRFLSDSRTLDTHIHRLRAKLEPDPAEPRFIVTVRGVGFRLDPDGSRPAPPARHGLRPDLPDQPATAAS